MSEEPSLQPLEPAPAAPEAVEALPPDRPGCLTAYVLLLWIGAGLTLLAIPCLALFAFLTPDPAIAVSMRAGLPGQLVSIPVVIFGVAQGVGLWHLRRWGFWLALVSLAGGLVNFLRMAIQALIGEPAIGLLFMIPTLILWAVLFYWLVKNRSLFQPPTMSKMERWGIALAAVLLALSLIASSLLPVLIPIPTLAPGADFEGGTLLSNAEKVRELKAVGVLEGVDAAAVEAEDPNAVANLLVESGTALIVDLEQVSGQAPGHYRPLYEQLQGLNEDLHFELAGLELLQRGDEEWGPFEIVVATLEQDGQTYRKGTYYSDDFPVNDSYYGVANQLLADTDSEYRLFEFVPYCEGDDCPTDEWFGGRAMDTDRLGLVSLTREQVSAVRDLGLLPTWGQDFDLLTTTDVEENLDAFARAGLTRGMSAAEIEEARTDVLLNLQHDAESLILYFEPAFYDFDAETTNYEDPYREVTLGLAGISRGEFQAEDIVDRYGEWNRQITREPIATLESDVILYESGEWDSEYAFSLNSARYEATLHNDADWLDLSFLDLINRALREQGAEGQFYALDWDDQWVVLLYLDPAQYAVLAEDGLLNLVPAGESRAAEIGRQLEEGFIESFEAEQGGE